MFTRYTRAKLLKLGDQACAVLSADDPYWAASNHVQTTADRLDAVVAAAFAASMTLCPEYAATGQALLSATQDQSIWKRIAQSGPFSLVIDAAHNTRGGSQMNDKQIISLAMGLCRIAYSKNPLAGMRGLVNGMQADELAFTGAIAGILPDTTCKGAPHDLWSTFAEAAFG